MELPIVASASCEIRSVIRFLCAEGNTAAEIHRRLCRVYGDGVMSDGSVRQWCRTFKNGRSEVHDEEGRGRHSALTDELVQKVDEVVRERRRFTISELSDDIPDISRSTLFRVITENLGYHKYCARWVPKRLTDVHKRQRVDSAESFLSRYREEGEKFLDKIVTGDETWIPFVNSETKEASKQWMHPHSPNKPKKFKQTFSNRKRMATVFWDRRGVLLVDFMPPGHTINSEVYCETLKNLRRAIQNKRRGQLTRGIVLLHDNARPHTAARTAALLNDFQWEVFNHPPYSPDLAPSDYHLFPKMKVWLGGHRFQSDDELVKSVNGWLSAQAAELFDDGIRKLIPRYQKCFDLTGDYVEK